MESAIAPPVTDLSPLNAVEFALLRDLIHAKTGIALKDAKRGLVASRLARRLRDLGLDSYTAYYRRLQADPGGVELRRMINCITTNKTSFFREEQHFPILADHLRNKVHASSGPYRVWSAACSTGEEPYSIAITALDTLPGAAADPESGVRILASDIDTDVLACAQQGVYPRESISQIDTRRQSRYFLCGTGELNGLVQVKPEVQSLVQFRHINLIEPQWPIHTRFDAIFCRNVIIYFDRDTQRRLFERLLGYLAPGGLLFVGHSETLCWLADLLVPVCHSVYRPRV